MEQSDDDLLDQSPSADADVALRQRTPADIERHVCGVGFNSSLDEIREAICASDWLMSRARSIQHLVNQIAIAWIDHNGEFDIGPLRYSVGYSTRVKCVDVPKAGRSILEAAGGDFDQFCSTLVAQPYKHGSVRSLVGQALHSQLFESQRVASLKSGVPERILKNSDRLFLK